MAVICNCRLYVPDFCSVLCNSSNKLLTIVTNSIVLYIARLPVVKFRGRYSSIRHHSEKLISCTKEERSSYETSALCFLFFYSNTEGETGEKKTINKINFCRIFWDSFYFSLAPLRQISVFLCYCFLEQKTKQRIDQMGGGYK